MQQLITEDTTSDILQLTVDRFSAGNSAVNDMGLVNGKMGVAVFLYHYANAYNDTAGTQLANGIIENIRNNLVTIASVDYNNGLCGIEAGLKYLLKKGFINAGMAEMPEVAEQAIYKSLFSFRNDNIHEYLYLLTGMGKYFMLDYRKKSLKNIGLFADINRQCLTHLMQLLGRIDITMLPRLNYKELLRVVDLLSMVCTTGFRLGDIRQFLSIALQALEAIIFNNADFKPFDTGCNPFCIVLVLLQAYNRTGNEEFITFAMRILKKYESAANNLNKVKDIPDADLLQHAVASKKLQTVLKDDYFGNCAQESFAIYRRRKKSTNDVTPGEGMALLTLEGHLGFDWLEELMGYY